MADYKSYIICTSPRSGSTLLCGLLAATGQAGRPESLFHQPSLSAWLSDYDLNAADYAEERQILRAIVERAIAAGTGTTGMFGLRLQRPSFAFLAQKLRVLHPDVRGDANRFAATFGPTLFIHLTREAKLDQAISLIKAQQTGLWHRNADGSELERLSAPQPPRYDRAAIAAALTDLSQMDTDWCAWFKGQGIAPLRLTYDALSQDPGAALAKVLGRLGFDPGIAAGVKAPVARLADQTSRNWAAQFKQDQARG